MIKHKVWQGGMESAILKHLLWPHFLNLPESRKPIRISVSDYDELEMDYLLDRINEKKRSNFQKRT